MSKHLAQTLRFCVQKQFWNSLDLSDFWRWIIDFVPLKKKKIFLTKQKKATTSVELHRQFTFEQDWILKGPSELLNPFAGLILFSFIFRIIAIWFLTELVLS